MLGLITSLLFHPVIAEECQCTAGKNHHEDKLRNFHQFSVTVDHVSDCKGHHNLEGRGANQFIGMLLHSAGIAEKIYIKNGKVDVKDNKTHITGWIHKKHEAKHISDKVKEGLEKICKEEKDHAKNAESQKKHGKCWVCYKLKEFKEWFRAKKSS